MTRPRPHDPLLPPTTPAQNLGFATSNLLRIDVYGCGGGQNLTEVRFNPEVRCYNHKPDLVVHIQYSGVQYVM